MTIHWMSFFLGAPVWGSLGIVVFAALIASARRSSEEVEGVGEAEPAQSAARAEEAASVVSLEERLRQREGARPVPKRGSRKRG